jgi:HAD superfamily hydrolase (TIGR01509 family)
MLQALIFDVDGTLADTERQGHRVAFNRAFAEAGLNWVWDEVLYGDLLDITGGKERLRHFIENYLPKLPVAESKLSEFIESLQSVKTRHYVELVVSGGIQPRPGVIRLLNEARDSGLRLAIATTTTPENVSALLIALFGKRSLDWFEIIGAGDSVPHKKPAPDVYQFVLERMEIEPKACLAVEDSENGLRSALSAQLPCLVTVNDYTSTQNFIGAACVVNHLGDPGNPLTLLTTTIAEKFEYIDVNRLRILHESTLLS